MFADSGQLMPDPDMALSLGKITAKASARVPFELACRRRRKVTTIKANVIMLSDGLFCARCARSLRISVTSKCRS